LRPAYPRPERAGWRRWVPSARQTLLGAVWCLTALVGTVLVSYELTGIPKNLNSFATQQDDVYYWADGTEMARVGPVDRQAMPLDRIPECVQWAVLSAENASFYTDHGVSPRGVSRAVWDMATGGDTQSGSTITQQYVKNVYLNQHQTLTRKVKEMFISVKLDNRMSKRQILDDYLNTSWFGRGAYGVQRAAKAYYGEDVSQVTCSQAAFLASLLKGAGTLDPALGHGNHARAVARWTWVLDRMVKTGHLSAARRASYTTFPEPKSPPRPAGLSGEIGYLVDTAHEYVAAHSSISDRSFDLGGYQIYTTFQRPATEALATAVGKERKAALHPGSHRADRNVRVGAASVATDGRIVALYGGPDYVKQGFDDADISIVPAGTVYAPLVYAAGLRDGAVLARDKPRTPVTPESLYDGDDKAIVRTPEGPYWSRDGKIVRARNTGHRSFGRITLRQAVADSVNAPIEQLGMDTGLNQVREASIAAGLLPDSFGEQVPEFSLGTATPSPIRLADAYATFAAHGTHTEPYSVLRVTRGGAAEKLKRPPVTHPFSAAVADEVGEALGDAVTGGSATAARRAGDGLAAVPGTDPGGRSAWFAGYDNASTGLSTAVAVFRIDPRTQQLEPLKGTGSASAAGPVDAAGSPFAAGIWTEYVKATRETALRGAATRARAR
jgi:membrane peptidoglycan carboxypeptidase